MNDTPKIAVFGSGPAAWIVAHLLEDEGLSPIRFANNRSSIWSIWSGLGGVYGPAAPMPSDSTGAVERRRSRSPRFTPDRASRWQRLVDRRGAEHPYASIGATPATLEHTISRVLELLPEGLFALTDDGTVRPGPHGSPAAPDVIAPSLQPLALRPDANVSIVAAPSVRGWSARGLAEQLGRARSIEAAVADVAPFAGLGAEHPVRVARELRELDDVSESLGDAVVDASSENDAEIVVLPPVVGATLEEHADWWSSFKLAAAHYGARVSEFPASQDPIFGWRLHRALEDPPEEDSRSTPSLPEPASGLRTDGGRVRAVVDCEGEECPVDAAVVATGRWFSGGLPAEPPLVEPLSGAPVWLDGSPVPNDPNLYPPDHLRETPWADHPLLRAGVGTDESLRMLDRAGDPIENLHAAGRILAGFNPFHDGCSLGVELVTAARAAIAVAESLHATKSEPSRDPESAP